MIHLIVVPAVTLDWFSNAITINLMMTESVFFNIIPLISKIHPSDVL